MGSESLTVRELLNGKPLGQKFDPMDIDLGEIKILSNAIPKDGNIDVNNAEVLATKYYSFCLNILQTLLEIQILK